MLAVRLVAGLVIAYAALTTLAWLFQDRLAFPAPRARLPDPARVGLDRVDTIRLSMKDGTRLAGWFLPPRDSGSIPAHSPGLLWFYGNGETIAAIWPILREFQPPGMSLLVVDYPGYGASEGRTTESRVYEAADLAYTALAERVDPARIFVYGRSLGTAVATRVAASHRVQGLVLESPFTNARDMGRRHYAFFPVFLMRIGLDNLDHISRVRCPVLVLHGTADRLVPIDMGRRVAAAAPGPVEFVIIEGAGHNETYEIGGRAYRERMWQFLNNTGKGEGETGKGTP